VLVEAALIFVALRPLQVRLRLRSAMGEPVGRRFLLGFAPFCAFSGNPKVDNGAHGVSNGNWIGDFTRQALSLEPQRHRIYEHEIVIAAKDRGRSDGASCQGASDERRGRLRIPISS
jgi:hypothetical protein